MRGIFHLGKTAELKKRYCSDKNRTGVSHDLSYYLRDNRETFVEPAKLMAMDAIDLMTDNASKARDIIRKTPPMTRSEYRRTLDELSRTEHFSA